MLPLSSITEIVGKGVKVYTICHTIVLFVAADVSENKDVIPRNDWICVAVN